MENNNLPSVIATDKLIEIVQTAPAILSDNRSRCDRAIGYGQNLLNKAKEGMNDELDKLLSAYQAKLRVTYKAIKEARQPFTQIVDEVKKEFTALESDIDPAGKTNIFFEVQKVRNAYVTQKIEEQKRKEAELLRIQAIEKEKIEIAKLIDIQINIDFNNYLSGVKKAMNNIFEGMSLESSKTAGKTLAATPVTLSRVTFNEFGKKRDYPTRYLQYDVVTGMIDEKKSESYYADLNDVCSVTLMEYRRELIDKIPSKILELQEIAKAGEEEAERLRVEAENRKAMEERRIKEESERKAIEAQQAAEIAAAGQSLEATINAEATLFTDQPKVKESYSIEVVHHAGYALLFQFWFEKEGKTLSADKIEKKTIGQMKSFAEGYALKNDEKIVSPLIRYNEVYKAK